jgi:hypothetical protein
MAACGDLFVAPHGELVWGDLDLGHWQLPTVVLPDGTKLWLQDGDLHRDNGLPAAILPDGEMEYWEHGVFLARSRGRRK